MYEQIVTDEYNRGQLYLVVNHLRKNAADGKYTLFHCTAGNDRTGIVSIALLKSYGVVEGDIICDDMRTNRNAFFPTIKKCIVCCLSLTIGSWSKRPTLHSWHYEN